MAGLVQEWDPSSDKFLDVPFDADTVTEGKAAAKKTLQKELGLAVGACPGITCHSSRADVRVKTLCWKQSD